MLHISQDGFEAVELPFENVGLVDFIRHDDELFLGCEVDDGFDIVLGEVSSSGIARIDHYNGSYIGTFVDGFLVGLLDSSEVGSPVCGFFEIVRNALGVENRERGRVEWILRDGYKKASVWGGADDV